jgi:hypothetical protein
MSGYLDYSGRDDVLSGGVRKIPVDAHRLPARAGGQRDTRRIARVSR